MDLTLIASAGLLGLAGAPHCTAMCSAPCAAAVGRGGTGARIGFHLARVVSYASAGAVVASSVALLAGWSSLSPAVRPLWVMLHMAALALGGWLLVRGRQPAWMGRLGRSAPAVAADAGGWQAMRGPARATLAGSLWVVWPCGLLQSALVVAALASHAATGAAAMAAFALASAPGLVLGPWALQHLLRGAQAEARERLAVRAAGGLLVLMSGWALGHGVWHQVAVFCGLA